MRLLRRDDADDLKQDAARFLEAGSASRELTSALHAAVVKKVDASVRAWNRRGGTADPSDVLQDILVKLLEHPPSRSDSENPVATILAWVGQVTVRHLISQRRKQRESSPGEDFDPPAPPVRTDDLLMVTWARYVVAHRYPTGLEVFDAMVAQPDAASAEIAASLSLSAANVDQIRSRIRKVLRQESEGGTLVRPSEE